MKSFGSTKETPASTRLYAWDSLWQLNRDQMIWRRFRTKRNAERTRELVNGPMIRTEATIAVNDLKGKLAIMRSHPDTPGVLPVGFEGLWFDVAEADPVGSIDSRLTFLNLSLDLGLCAVREAYDPSLGETTEIAPHLASPVTAENSATFIEDPLVLAGVTIFVKSRAS